MDFKSLNDFKTYELVLDYLQRKVFQKARPAIETYVSYVQLS